MFSNELKIGGVTVLFLFPKIINKQMKTTLSSLIFKINFKKVFTCQQPTQWDMH